eukprot:CAMPEP_0181393012 /NCGR_PEP_ID=MMETSP1106-20121128/26932_1 /TAXON_ID=81844 /ORGANISM="Mantoniella antarctica, Strain SL-175" /LENGTH=74 /DNA_ID=CAMNT_0023514243 /DNA_START=154 /DNA_END=378 /DNA_ORIENTATION=+
MISRFPALRMSSHNAAATYIAAAGVFAWSNSRSVIRISPDDRRFPGVARNITAAPTLSCSSSSSRSANDASFAA